MRELKVLRYYKGAGPHRQINPRPDLNKIKMRKDKCPNYLLAFSARPARPETWVSNWNVCSLERKSGKFREVSAFNTQIGRAHV